MMLIGGLCLVAWPALAQMEQTDLIGNWSGSGFVRLNPDSSARDASCDALFEADAEAWLTGSVVCETPRGSDRVLMRFSSPDDLGRLSLDIMDEDGDALVSLPGVIEDDRLTLTHPDELEFGGIAYKPILQFEKRGTDDLGLSQLGVPTRRGSDQYLMSDFLLERTE